MAKETKKEKTLRRYREGKVLHLAKLQVSLETIAKICRVLDHEALLILRQNGFNGEEQAHMAGAELKRAELLNVDPIAYFRLYGGLKLEGEESMTSPTINVQVLNSREDVERFKKGKDRV